MQPLATGALFFLSGALGLVYEVVWFRRLHLALGVGIYAVGAVLSAFMLGLALGSRWASRSARLRASPLVAYAAIEAGVAAYALAFPWLVAGAESLYPALFGLLEARPLALALVRFLLAFALLLPPTFLMGASLPAVAQSVGAAPSADGTAGVAASLAHRVAWLYAANTLGGVVGTLLAGFFLVERLGLTGSLYFGAAGSVIVGMLALALSRRREATLDAAHATPEPDPPAKRSRRAPRAPKSAAAVEPRPAATLALAAAGLAGVVSLASEIVWARALVFFVHNSTYAFSAIVAVYLLGIAGGAALAGRLSRSAGAAARWLAATLLAGSASLLLAIVAYRSLPRLAQALAGSHRLAAGVTGASEAGLLLWSWGDALAVIFGQVALVLFLPALFFGAVFPLSLQLASPREGSAAEHVGRLYAVNALGSVAGTLLGTFVFVALLGTRGALLLLAWLPVPLALWALCEAHPRRRLAPLVAAALVGGLAGASALAAPAGFYRGLFEQRFGRVLWFSEGVSETVAVCEYKDGSRWIQFSDGRGASGTSSYQGGWLYAHLPLLLHRRPQSAAVICFGTGNTLAAASRHGLDRLDGIELSSEVVAAAPQFAATNDGIATSGSARIVIEDGRNYLLATRRSYDVITEEPPLVHTAGVVNLYSRDFYELAARRLTRDGLVAVWLATWELEPEEMRRLVRAFVDVFPYASVWDCTHPYEWLLIGSKQAPRLDLDALARRMAEPAIARDLARIDPDLGGLRTPAELLSLHLMDREAMVRFADGAPAVTDDRSVVDFTSPRHARANFGLGEWVTGGLTAAGVGELGLRSELGLREFDRAYAFRDSPLPLVASYGSQRPETFAAELRARAARRELKAAALAIGSVRRLAADLRALGQRERSLEAIERGLGLVPRRASAPLHEMRAQLLREMGRESEARAADAARAAAPAAQP